MIVSRLSLIHNFLCQNQIIPLSGFLELLLQPLPEANIHENSELKIDRFIDRIVGELIKIKKEGDESKKVYEVQLQMTGIYLETMLNGFPKQKRYCKGIFIRPIVITNFQRRPRGRGKSD